MEMLDTEMFTSISVRILYLPSTLTLSHPPETKNTWARDDPAILILVSACLFGERNAYAAANPLLMI